MQVPLPVTSSKVVVHTVVERFNNFHKQQINEPHNEVTNNEPSVDEPHEIVLRSQRQKKSVISNDYVVYLQESKFDLGIDEDPISFSQAMRSVNSTKWLDVMKEQLKEVWDLVELPKDSKKVRCKWIFKTKLDSNGNVE